MSESLWYDSDEIVFRLSRVEKKIPDHYRLAKRLSGETILQGAYFWQEGNNQYGHTWRDIPTINLEE
jgi:hypothetical protein